MADFWTRRWLHAVPNTTTDLAVARQDLRDHGITNFKEWLVFTVDMADMPFAQPSPEPSASASPSPPAPGPSPLAVARIIAYAGTRFGLPVTGAYEWGGYVFRQYRGGAETESEGRCVVCDSPHGTFVVKSGFAQKYFEPGRVETLGAPTENEHQQDVWPAWQSFERGHLTWRADTGVVVWL